jgi:hypothetical protein
VENTRRAALLAEIDLRAVNLVEQHCGDGTKDLESKVLGLDDVDTRDELFDDERKTACVVDGDSVGFSADDDGGFGAFGDEDGVGEGSFDFNRLIFKVFLLGG